MELPFNIPEILKFGIIGLGAIMAILSFWLLRNEQDKPQPRKAILHSIYIFMAFSLLLTITGMLAPAISRSTTTKGYVVPEEKKVKVDSLPASTYGEYKLIKDISIFDLRGWKPVGEGEQESKSSPANYINYLHVKKTKAINKIVAHYSTGGYDIDLRCITHNYTTYVQTPGNADHPDEKNYGIEIDVSNIPTGEEFLIVIEATYWNGFTDIVRESASTYTDKEIEGLEELALIVLLPYDKPVKEVFRYGGQGNAMQPYREAEKYYLDQNKRFVYWSVKKISPDTHYKLEWLW
jgi:hypothetical protein